MNFSPFLAKLCTCFHFSTIVGTKGEHRKCVTNTPYSAANGSERPMKLNSRAHYKGEDLTNLLPDGLVWFQDKLQPSVSNGLSKRSEDRVKKNPLSIGSTDSID